MEAVELDDFEETISGLKSPQLIGCPFNSEGTAAGSNPPNGNGCANSKSISPSSDDRELSFATEWLHVFAPVVVAIRARAQLQGSV